MPVFLLNIIISLAIKFGLAFLFRRFPGIPQEIRDLLSEFLDKLKLAKSAEEKNALKAEVKAKVKKHCEGTGCPMDVKG